MAARRPAEQTLDVTHSPAGARRRASRRTAFLIALGLALATACSSSRASSAPTAAPAPATTPAPAPALAAQPAVPRSPGDDVLPAYTPPDPLQPGQPGDVVKATPWQPVPGLKTWLVLY